MSPNVLPFINILQVLNEIPGISERKRVTRDSKLNLDISLDCCNNSTLCVGHSFVEMARIIKFLTQVG